MAQTTCPYKNKSAMGNLTLASHSTALTKGGLASVQHSPKVGRHSNMTSHRFGSLGSGMKHIEYP
jgi:hypothetical protein